MSSITLHPIAATAAQPRSQDVSAGAASSSAGSTASDQTSLDSLGSTFMQLLVQELQNQDPTAPMDSTQMVGQMISLNQLNQIASIHQLLDTSLSGASSGTSGTPSPTGSGS